LSFGLSIAWLAFAALLAVQQLAAPQNDRARTEALARRATARLQALHNEADRLANQERSLLNDLRRLEVDRQLKAEELKQIDAEAVKVQQALENTRQRVDVLQASEAAERPELRARLIEMYKLGQARYARLLLSAPDLRRLGQTSRTVAALAKIDRDRIAAHQRTLADLRTTRVTLEERRRQVVALRVSAGQAQAAAIRSAQAQSDLIRDIDRRRDLNAQLSGELQAAQQKLQAALRDASNGVASTEPATLPLSPFRGDLGWPVNGEVHRRFGRSVGLLGSSANGMEIAAPDGAPVTAIHEGVVAFAGSFAGFGNLVILDHGSQAFSLYGDLLQVVATKGARLDRGQPIGSTGPLPGGGSGLYFELRIDGKPVDPLQWLKRR
jgi:septal ring factor EnvC (AmiA/AmiB activator)